VLAAPSSTRHVSGAGWAGSTFQRHTSWLSMFKWLLKQANAVVSLLLCAPAGRASLDSYFVTPCRDSLPASHPRCRCSCWSSGGPSTPPTCWRRAWCARCKSTSQTSCTPPRS
jgi:hypothetical protein